jgi:hypothetical protein
MCRHQYDPFMDSDKILIGVMQERCSIERMSMVSFFYAIQQKKGVIVKFAELKRQGNRIENCRTHSEMDGHLSKKGWPFGTDSF